MLEFAHALTGATIAAQIPNPAISLPLAFLSHFAVDLLPHWNPDLKQKKKKEGLFYLPTPTIIFILLDSLLGLALGLYIALKALPEINRALLALAGAFLAVLPDLAEAPYLFLNLKSKLVNRLITFQKSHQWKVAFLPGIIIQALYATLLLLLNRSLF